MWWENPYQAIHKLLHTASKLLEALLDIAGQDADLARRHAGAQVLERAQPLLCHALAQLLHALLRPNALLLRTFDHVAGRSSQY